MRENRGSGALLRRKAQLRGMCLPRRGEARHAALYRGRGAGKRALPKLLRAHAAVEVRLRLRLDRGCRDAFLVFQRASRGVVHKVENRPLVCELDLGFGGVNVHVHACKAHRKLNYARGETPRQERVFVCLLHRRLQKGGADVPAVAVEILGAAVAASGGRGGDEAGYAHILTLALTGEHILCDVASEQGVYAGVEP